MLSVCHIILKLVIGVEIVESSTVTDRIFKSQYWTTKLTSLIICRLKIMLRMLFGGSSLNFLHLVRLVLVQIYE